MNDSLVDMQLKQLTRLCLSTRNYSKLGAVAITLISNQLDAIGIQLGIKPRNKDAAESMAAYMQMVNALLQTNFGLTLFPADLLEKLRYMEAILSRRTTPLDEGTIEIIRTLIYCYYELRRLEVPNVYQTLAQHEFFREPQGNILSFLSRGGSAKKRQSMKGITPLILQKLHEEEKTAEQQLQYHYDPALFEKTLQLKTIRKSFQRQKSGKIVIQGSLHDNINYLQSKEQLLQYFLLGWILVLCMLGTVVLTQTIFYPATVFGTSPYLLIIFGPCAILILLYRYYSQLGGDMTV